MTHSTDDKATAVPALSRGNAGFTLLEILVVLVIVTVLSAISYPIYNSYIDKAKITRAIYTLEVARKALEDYHINNLGYPPTIDFSSGLDGQGRAVLSATLLADFRSSIFAVDNYTVSNIDYSISVRAKDGKHTALVLTPGQVITQGP